MAKIKLILAIRSLDIGGTERQFVELTKNIDKTKFDVTVCTMYGGIQEDMVKQVVGIKYINLQKNGRFDFYNFYNNYSKILKEVNPDVVYSFLGEMNIFSLFCKQKHTKIIWGFRASNMNLRHYGKVSQIIFWMQKKLSNKIDKIISNSNASIDFHKEQGFNMNKSVVVHNGINTNFFKRDTRKRNEFREKYNLKKSDIAIGIVARIDYMKGYLVFSKVAKKICETYPNIYFFSVGGGDDMIKNKCETILDKFNTKKFIWLGQQNNMVGLYSGLDISVSSSLGEGFSNSIAEAMSCELPCVVTDVGDSATIVNDIGLVIEPNNIEDLYNGLMKMINSNYKDRGVLSRKRVTQSFSINKMIISTEKEIEECIKQGKFTNDTV